MDSDDIRTLERIEAYALGALNASDCMAFRTIVDNIRMLIDKLKKQKINPLHHSSSHLLNSNIDEIFTVNNDYIFLPKRAINCLKLENINTINDLINTTEQQLITIPSCGKKSLEEVKEFLAALGFHLKQ